MKKAALFLAIASTVFLFNCSGGLIMPTDMNLWVQGPGWNMNARQSTAGNADQIERVVFGADQFRVYYDFPTGTGPEYTDWGLEWIDNDSFFGILVSNAGEDTVSFPINITTAVDAQPPALDTLIIDWARGTQQPITWVFTRSH